MGGTSQPVRTIYYHKYECYCGLERTHQGYCSKPSEFTRCDCGGKMYPQNTAELQRQLTEIYQHQ